MTSKQIRDLREAGRKEEIKMLSLSAVCISVWLAFTLVCYIVC